MKLQIYATMAAIAMTCLLLPNLHPQAAQASFCGWCFSNGHPVSQECANQCTGYQQPQATTQQIDWNNGYGGGGVEDNPINNWVINSIASAFGFNNIAALPL